MKYEDKLKLVKRKFKNTTNVFDIEMINYNGCNIYIRLDYYKKEKSYKISWVDLNVKDDKSIVNYINTQFVANYFMDQMINIVRNIEFNDLTFKDKKVLDSLVVFNLYVLLDHKKTVFEYAFHRHVPLELHFIFDILSVVFDVLPSYLNNFFMELGAVFFDTVEKYDYENPILFNLKKDNLNDIFRKGIVTKGKKYYEEKNILFLEKDGETYTALVKDKKDCVVKIGYYEKTTEMILNCSCSCGFYCKHIYAVLLAIRNDEFRKFYKVMLKEGFDKKSIYEKVATFRYFYCAGIKNNDLILIVDGIVQYVPIYDEYGAIAWEVIEDDEENRLKKELQNK